MSSVNESDRAVLTARARALARPALLPGVGQYATETGQIAALEILLFRVGGTRLALESRYVREALVSPRVTPLPGAPSHLLGVFSLRGKILPLFDGACIFSDRPEKDDSEKKSKELFASHVLVLGQDALEVAVRVSQAFGVSLLSRSSLHAPPSGLPRTLYASVLGVTDDAIVCLDGKAFLQHPALRVALPSSHSGSTRS